jgi:hypothetical protein
MSLSQGSERSIPWEMPIAEDDRSPCDTERKVVIYA